jgi:RNA polymerase sigma factor (sigma-70 family)
VDQARVAELYRAHVPPMRAFASLLLNGDQHRAEDIVHDAFIKSVTKLPSMRDEDRFAAYLRRAVVNAIASWGRRQSVERRWLARQVRGPRSSDQALAEVDDTDGIVKILQTLPPRQRLAVTARICLDLSEAQTADLLGCSVGTVKSLTSRGLAALRAVGAAGYSEIGERR